MLVEEGGEVFPAFGDLIDLRYEDLLLISLALFDAGLELFLCTNVSSYVWLERFHFGHGHYPTCLPTRPPGILCWGAGVLILVAPALGPPIPTSSTYPKCRLSSSIVS